MASLQPFDLTEFLQLKEAVRPEQAENAAGQTAAAALPVTVAETCRAMAECLRATSALIVRDPRCAQADNDRFLDMMESYFAQPKTTKLAHSRPELHYQLSAVAQVVQACLNDRFLDMMEAFFALPVATNDRFLDMMEAYFAQPGATKLAHSRPELHHQRPLFVVCLPPHIPPAPTPASSPPPPRAVRLAPCAAQMGVTPEGVEMPQSALDDAVKARMAQLPADTRVYPPSVSGVPAVPAPPLPILTSLPRPPLPPLPRALPRALSRAHFRALSRAFPGPEQVGVTPEGVEMPQSALDDAVKARMAQLPADSRPHAPSGPDCKWRFMWRVGPRPARTRYQELNASPVVPEGFPQWASVMDGWGCKMTAAVEAVAEMLAIGFDLPQDSFTCRMHMFLHSPRPTSPLLSHRRSNLLPLLHPSPGPTPAGSHRQFPGLRIWLRDGTCCRVSVPDGCLLLQAGKQMEWLTGGEVPAGMHEVVVDEGTVVAVQRAQQQGRSLWRVSSTVFAQIASDEILTPIGHFATSKLASSFPPKPAGEFVEEELAAIQLKTTSGGG
ncbi:unnamed protein product [Closterium sp. Naga37s-1]|nr:unnamed protein product [Closterium sp. Naga37s-1]